DRPARQGLRVGEGGVRVALRAQQSARLGEDSGRRHPPHARGRGKRLTSAGREQKGAAGVTQARASAFGELDIWLARAGRHEQLYAKLGAHRVDGGVRFAVWAPNARYVSVIGDFNDWDPARHQLEPVDDTGIWEGVVEGARVGQRYKYHLDGREKADPVAFEAEVPPKTASVIFESEYEWHDADW